MEKIGQDRFSGKPPQIFFSAGEPSGDIHAASLIREIRQRAPEIQCVGYGGPEMQAAGCELHYDMTQLAIMWFARLFTRFFRFRQLFLNAEKYLKNNNVKAVVLVDFPGFNWWIASAAKKCGIPVYYYMPPQIWAWGQWRIQKMYKFVQTIFTCLPFETRWYREEGCHVIEIGHPFIEEAKHQIIDLALLEELRQEKRPILAVLPGSRDQEVANNFSDILKAVLLVKKQHSDVQPMIAVFKESHVSMIKKQLKKAKVDFPILVRQTQELIRVAHSCVAVSGSVSMELMVNRVPTVIYYRVSRFAHHVQRWFRRVRYITLVNLLGAELLTPHEIYIRTKLAPKNYSRRDREEMVFPEYLTSVNRSLSVANVISDWLLSQEIHEESRRKLKLIHESLQTEKSPFSLAAKEILRNISAEEHFPSAPHFPVSTEKKVETMENVDIMGQAKKIETPLVKKEEVAAELSMPIIESEIPLSTPHFPIVMEQKMEQKMEQAKNGEVAEKTGSALIVETIMVSSVPILEKEMETEVALSPPYFPVVMEHERKVVKNQEVAEQAPEIEVTQVKEVVSVESPHFMPTTEREFSSSHAPHFFLEKNLELRQGFETQTNLEIEKVAKTEKKPPLPAPENDFYHKLKIYPKK